MAVPQKTALAQWQKIEALVRVWLDQRQRIIVHLCALQGLQGLDQGRPRAVEPRVREFCQLLVDYISAGYFEVYRELVREAHQFRDAPPALAAQILKRLDASTGEALTFNEDFDTGDQRPRLLGQLPERLARLTDVLEERFALEDQLILSVHQQSPPGRGLRVH